MVDVVDFREKWIALRNSGLRPEIKTYSDLAKYLEVSGKGAIGNWFASKDEYPEIKVPDEHIDKFIKVYSLDHIIPGIDRYTFASMPIEDFKLHLGEGLPVWDRLYKLSEMALGRVAMQRVSVLGTETRGVELVENPDDFKGEPFVLGEPFRLHLQGPAEWWAVVLLKDPDGIHCLTPRETIPYQALGSRDEGLFVPTERSFKATRPLGQHWWLVVLTAKKLAPAVCNKLADPQPSFRKEGIADLYNELALFDNDDYRVYRLPFHVVAEP